ncbi:MAG: hypothetical protein E7105_09130 [Prevotella sp.]|nr:hypothetical protein [Prevotella sp.]
MAQIFFKTPSPQDYTLKYKEIGKQGESYLPIIWSWMLMETSFAVQSDITVERSLMNFYLSIGLSV